MLWKLSDIEAARIPPTGLPTLRRVVVAIDAAVSNENSDETGIIVAGRADKGIMHRRQQSCPFLLRVTILEIVNIPVLCFTHFFSPFAFSPSSTRP